MSKKLIAVAAAAALALSALVAAPAAANTVTIAVDGSSSTGSTAAAPAKHASPESNVIQWQTNGSSVQVTGTAVRIDITATAVNGYSIRSAGGVKLLSSLTDAKTTSGTELVEGTFATSSSTITVYAYSTSTATGTVTVVSGGNTSVRYVASRVGTAYNVAATFPAFAAEGGSADIFAVLTDVFGNKIIGGGSAANNTNKTINQSEAFTMSTSRLVPTAVGATATGSTWTWDAVKAAFKFSTSAVTSGSVALKLTLATDDYSASTGFAKPVLTAFATINSTDAAGTITTLTAQVATLQAQVATLQASMANMRTTARSVTKKKYNTLARKWNAANPGARVALK